MKLRIQSQTSMLWMDKQFHPTLYDECDYVFMLGLALIRVSKMCPWKQTAPKHKKREQCAYFMKCAVYSIILPFIVSPKQSAVYKFNPHRLVEWKAIKEVYIVDVWYFNFKSRGLL